MARPDSNIIKSIVVHQILVRWLVFLALVTRFYMNFIAPRNRRRRMRDGSYSVTGKIHAQIDHLRRIVEVGDVQCLVNLRMNRNAFARLCYLLSHVGGIADSRYVRCEEKVAIFLSILAHHKKNRIVGHDYLRSGWTISVHFHEVLQSVLKLYPILLVKPVPVDDNCSNDSWKWFKGCLGALDGTYVSVHVPNKDKPKFRTRKGTISVNVLGVCDSDMKFIYVLTGWEGSAADARVLRDVVHRHNGLKVPRGNYYLCDNDYGNVEGFLTPYRRTRYHLADWGTGPIVPQNYKECFNLKHCRARNVIERAFGLLKRRWAVLRSPTFYPLKVQNDIILACILLHNFIRTEMPDDPLQEPDGAIVDPIDPVQYEFIENLDSSTTWDAWRDNMAMSMYNNR